MIIGKIAYAASPSQEDNRIFETQASANAYLLTPNAKAGQGVKIKDTTSGKYKAYIIQGTTGSFSFAPAGAGDYVATSGQDFPLVGDGDLNYYKYNSTKEIYEHYRYSNGEYVIVGGDTYSQDEIDAMFAAQAYVADVTETATGLLFTFKDGTTKSVALNKETTVSDVNPHLNEDNVQDGITIEYTDGTSKDIEIQGGGGGGSSSGAATITRVTPAATQCVYSDHSCPITYTFTAVDSGGDTVGNGTATWYVGGIKKATTVALQGNNTFDVGQYLTVGQNNVKLSIVVDTGGDVPVTTSKTWTVNSIDMYVEWEYNDATINMENEFTIYWTPYGELEKTTHIVIDEGTQDEIVKTSTTVRSGYRQSMTLSRTQEGLTHGSHLVKMYLTATVNGEQITSTPVYHDVIFVDGSSNVPIIASNFVTTAMTQYDTVQIPLVIYTPNNLTSNATLSVNGTQIDAWTGVDRTVHYWNYTPNDYGTKTLTVTCGATSKTFTIVVSQLDIDNEEIGGYTFKLKASDLAGNNALQSWVSNGINATFSNNFDWNNGGIKTETDENGNIRQYICVKAGTTMTINHKLFADDARVNGKTIKMIFKTDNCRNYDASIATCYADGVGIQLNAYNAQFSSTGTSLSVPYSEKEYIELEFDVYPSSQTGRYMMAWIDGVITSARVYNVSDNFTQSNANQQNIIIGSQDCDVYVYLVKVYPTYLTRANHIENFIADAPNAQEMVKRYNRNNILNGSGGIDYEKLAENNPDCRIWLYDIPYMTIGKKDYVQNCIFNQIWYNGNQYYTLSGKGTMSVQGTSSVDYLRGAANTDINFTELYDGDENDLLADGVVDKDTYGNNFYVGDTSTGTVTVFDVDENTVLTPDCIPVERDNSGNVTKYIKALGYKINDNSTPISYSNTKVNFASCEQVNNMCNAIWYQRFQPYQSLTPRDCMEFSMGVQFIKDSGTVPDNDHFVLFGNNRYNLYSIGNMGTSKKNVHVFHDLSNPLDCCIEVGNNLNDLCRMVTDDMSDLDWSGKIEGKDHSFEMRYPDTSNPSTAIKNAWQRFVTWMATNNPNAATGENLAQAETYGEYTFRGHSRGGTQVLKGTKVTKYAGTYTKDTFDRRMAKMLSECEDYLVMDSVIYHFVYIERHTMCDNVSKNTFWSSSDGLHWDLSKAYDMDTSDGNNNEGQMVFDYGYEAEDVIGTKTVFNANDAVWFVFASNLYEACQTMFVNRDALGAWSATAYHNFMLEQQRKIPERVWVECYWYDYLRTYENGINESWISFLDGGQKIHQRWHYESFEEIYDSSKYQGINCTANNINFRGYHPEKWDGITNEQWAQISPLHQIPIKMYNKCYINVSIDGNLYRQKVARGQLYTVDFSNQSKLNDTVINIYSAQMIQEIGNMSRLYPGTLNLSNAVRLRSLEIGSDKSFYKNSNLLGVSVGQNTMLEYLYVQNLGYVTGGLDLTKCIALKYLDAGGSTFTSYDFANGGLIEEAIIESPTALTMRNLHYLDDAHLTISSFSRLTSLTLENCPGIDDEDLLDDATALIYLRLLGVNWSLYNTTRLNALLQLQGIDENGFNTAKSILGGLVEIIAGSAVRSSDLDSYYLAGATLNPALSPAPDGTRGDYWAGLTLSYDSDYVVPAYKATYVNYDGTVLYETYVDYNELPPNPVALGLISTPTRPADAQYIYTYSGWDGIDSAMYSPRTITAQYSTTDQVYVVNWYSNGELLLSKNTSYGAEEVYDEALPTNTSEVSAGYYNVFKGWDKSTANIKPYNGSSTLNVNAIYERSPIPTAGKDLSEMTAGEIYAVTQSGRTTQYFSDKDYFDLVMGEDFDFTNVESHVLAQNHVLDGTESKVIDTNIYLCGENDQTFTLALDYTFASTNTDDTIISCNDGDDKYGFRLKFSTNPTLEWGNTSQAVGTYESGREIRHYRGIVVIRHIAGTNTLSVYYSKPASRFNETVTKTDLTRTNAATSTNPLTIGGVRFSLDGGHDYLTKGTVHWCKIWMDDLGDTNARKLAAWTHETIRMEFCGNGRYRFQNGGSAYTNASFIANNLLGDSGYYMNSTNTNSGGWLNSAMKAFLNGRFYDGLPQVWKSMLKKTRIYSTKGGGSSDLQDPSYDYVYIPCLKEVQPSNSTAAYVAEGDGISWFVANSNPTKPDGITPSVVGSSTTMTENMTRIKFYGQIIPEDATYYVSADDPYLSYPQISTGDIWIKSNSSSNGYIFVEQSIINARGYNPASGFTNAKGGYLAAPYWWLRSPNTGGTSHFWLVYPDGYVGSNGAGNVSGVCAGFSI